jgi:hypothetical protein
LQVPNADGLCRPACDIANILLHFVRPTSLVSLKVWEMREGMRNFVL